ncbi:2-isopropylmalate synthase [Acetohalobium arabaticum]|uniref:2-isopropylmalate synthase n=1 Tax=Acetohalobium arabaticum (strain ATCC 49924 / DSM 5501 / Z-7288) TaxID=574087 RepID=D9QTJ5_ACEAZ|nr:2-isopropylmalate synthase [Acetohalobium arabaticum]ADL11759.1 2-isopropylmalate synthase [Acetohalobium arabaticum DSM 5501]
MSESEIKIFDTTLRDGEQSPGVSLNIEEKLEIAHQLANLDVDVIEAGFPIASEGDFEAVKQIAKEVQGPVIAGLARTTKGDIDRAWEALKYSDKPRIHTFIATSPVHMEYKLQKSPNEVLESVTEAVEYAKSYTDDVEFSAEDAFRSDKDFLCQVVEKAVAAGATTVNIPDTVGYATPAEFGGLIEYICNNVPNIEETIISVHCHNDLGLAVANSLAAIEKGAQQIECAVNGIGERAGNTALEEVVMALNTRCDYFDQTPEVTLDQIYKTSKLVSSLTGMSVQANKAIVGKNAFAHESGIHQDGVIKERTTYEIMDAKTIGLSENQIVLGKHSGRHAFKERLAELGYELEGDNLEKAFKRFKELADRKKSITDRDLEALVEDELKTIPQVYELMETQVTSGNEVLPTATLKLKFDEEVIIDSACCEGGPIDAVYETINRITGLGCELESYAIDAITSGKDALGEVTVKLNYNEELFIGRGVSIDVIEASAKAYLNAVNKILYKNEELIGDKEDN